MALPLVTWAFVDFKVNFHPARLFLLKLEESPDLFCLIAKYFTFILNGFEGIFEDMINQIFSLPMS